MSDKREPGGVTRLMHAASLKIPEELLRLLAKSKDGIDQADDDGWTALHIAASCGLQDNVSILCDAGANPFFKNKDKETPLDIAIKRGHLEIAVLLQKAEKEAPLIKPEDLPARVVELEKMVEALRQQVADMTASKKGQKKKANPSVKKSPSCDA
jgi:ankyrin repeat protein